MNIQIVTPAPPGSNTGNRVTARRWAGILRTLGHRVSIENTYREAPCDLLIALHARRSSLAVRRFARRHPDRPIIVALTGTDVYRDLGRSARAVQSIERASRLVVLQPAAAAEIPPRHRSKARVIYQSVTLPAGLVHPEAPRRAFEVCVIGHLRPVKDPFRTAAAARLLPEHSKIEVLHIGRAMTGAMKRRALKERSTNRRYRWLGERSRSETLRRLARARLLVLSSRMEGGANVLSEAIAVSTPVLGSRIPGTVGILGEDYPGYFPVGDTRALGRLLQRAETDPGFLADLQARCTSLADLVRPARERRDWERLLNEL